jgi:hypothetical protein
MKKLMKYIKENYSEGEPILTKDLKKINISYDNLRQKLKKLTDSNQLNRIDDGIYSYGSLPKADIVIENKYIKRNNKVFGYYTKETLLKLLGLNTNTDQIEIVTNEFRAIVREIEVAGTKIKIRHSKIKINNENYYILQFLDLIRDLDKLKIKRNDLDSKLKMYIEKYKIDKNDINKYINLYPNVTYRNYYKYNIENMLFYTVK